jgi:hypothetical protein
MANQDSDRRLAAGRASSRLRAAPSVATARADRIMDILFDPYDLLRALDRSGSV